MAQNQGQGDTSRRGFASMDEAKQREIASKGGQASGGNFKNDPARAAQAGSQGGHARAQQSAARTAQQTAGIHSSSHAQQGGGMPSKQSR